jgi:hypothetical protein
VLEGSRTPSSLSWLCTGLRYHFPQANQASVSGAACFPPTMPLHSEGNCRSLDGTWILGWVLAPLFSLGKLLTPKLQSSSQLLRIVIDFQLIW